MKLEFLLTLLALLAAAFAWDDQDHEIFDLVSAVEAAEGKGTTFYSWLGVPHTASTNEISKAYRKLSMQLHPDKNPNNKKIHERYARLTVVSTILRNAESRERYDFFYKNGVPKWRGTGYYYSRFRPGLGTVFVFLTMVTCGLQYVIQGMNYKRDLARVEKFMADARLAAWGPKLIPTDGPRKVKVGLGERHDEDGNPLGTRTIDMVVEGTNVYILENGEMHPLDASAAVPPSVSRLWFPSLVNALYRKVVSPKPAVTENPEEASDGYGSDGTGSEIPGSGTVTPNLKSTSRESSRGPTSKTGGKRRKAPKRR